MFYEVVAQRCRITASAVSCFRPLPPPPMPQDLLMQIRTGDIGDPRVVALLEYHTMTARAQTAPGSAHALDLNAFSAPDIALWTGWDGETLVAVGALKMISAAHGEVKSMHTLEMARRRGFAGQMLRH